MDVFPDKIMLAFMLYLPLKSLVVFSSVCKRIRILSKELLNHPHFVGLKKEFVLARLTSETIWPQECWRNIESLAVSYMLSFKRFKLTGFRIANFVREHGKYFIMEDRMVWNLKFGLPDK